MSKPTLESKLMTNDTLMHEVTTAVVVALRSGLAREDVIAALVRITEILEGEES